MNTAVSTDAEHSEDSHGDDHDHGLSDVGYIKIALIQLLSELLEENLITKDSLIPLLT